MELKSKEEIKAMTLDEKRLYLGELKQYKAQLEASKGLREQGAGLKRASETMMKYDPTGAFDLMDKAAQTEIDRQKVEQAGMKDKYDPDTVRFKLASRLNAITGLMAKMDANEPEYAGLVSESAKIKEELEKDNPSIQSVYASGEIETPPPTTGATYESIQTLINGATKNTFEKVKSQVATDKGAAKLSAEQEKYIDELLEQKRKQLFPAEKKRPEKSVDETRKLALNALGELIKWSEASKLDPNVPSDLLLLAKIKSRGYANEAYMSDDANLSGDTIRKFFSQVTGFTELPKADGIKFKNEIPANYSRALTSVKKYLDDRYFNSISQALYDNIEETLKLYPLAGSKNLTGELRVQPQKSGQGKQALLAKIKAAKIKAGKK